MIILNDFGMWGLSSTAMWIFLGQDNDIGVRPSTKYTVNQDKYQNHVLLLQTLPYISTISSTV